LNLVASNSENSTVQQPRANNYTHRNRLFCIIPATPDSFKSLKAFTVLNAWANKCDNYRFVLKIPVSLVKKAGMNASSNQASEMAFGNGNEVNEPVNLLHPIEMFKDEYAKLTSKMFFTIKDIYLKHIDQYDWFLKGFLFICLK
jgi:hypothetical protein